MRIVIDVVPHGHQRYETVGDWQYSGDDLVISVSDTGNRMSNLLVGVHELIEAELCKYRGITQQQVDEFDIAFEAARVEGNTEEPGNSPLSPYHREHAFAEIVERMLAFELGIDWFDHDLTVSKLSMEEASR